MLNQITSANRFNKNKPSILMKQVINRPEMIVKSPPKKMLDVNMYEEFRLQKDVQKYCSFCVDVDGVYSLSTQLCVKMTGLKPVCVDFLQFGVCVNDDIGESNFNSILVSCDVEKDYLISNNLSCLMKLKCDEQYSCWLNLSSSNNEDFVFDCEHSNCKLIAV